MLPDVKQRTIQLVISTTIKTGTTVYTDEYDIYAREDPMRVLFIHPNFPAQYRHTAAALAALPGNEVVYLTKPRDRTLPGVRKVEFQPKREAHPSTHHYLQGTETAVLNGQAIYRAASALKAKGFAPDVVCAHIGWGASLFVKDVFPDTPLLLYCEWYYHPRGADTNFDPEYPLTEDDALRIRVKNVPGLLAMEASDWGLAPTDWQRQQFPGWYRERISVLHDGVDTGYFVPAPGARLKLPGLDLSAADELVTYVARGMEPYRGFHKMVEAIPRILARRPNCHVVIVGEDRVCYGKKLPEGQTYKQLMLERVPLDPARVHFTGPLPYGQYLQVLQASAVHVYLTFPFVLSWSMIEAMSAGCLVLGSDTAPVTEVIREGENGLLVDFFSPEAVAARIDEVLSHPTRMAKLRERARVEAIARFDLGLLLPRHLELIVRVAERRF